MKKAGKQLVHELHAYLAGDLYWPGGKDGGGSRRGSGTTPVVRPHKRTTASCLRCGQFHTTAEHEQEAGSFPPSPASALSAPPKARKRGAVRATTPTHGEKTGRTPSASALLSAVNEA